jgi:hypothetical protein
MQIAAGSGSVASGVSHPIVWRLPQTAPLVHCFAKPKTRESIRVVRKEPDSIRSWEICINKATNLEEPLACWPHIGANPLKVLQTPWARQWWLHSRQHRKVPPESDLSKPREPPSRALLTAFRPTQRGHARGYPNQRFGEGRNRYQRAADPGCQPLVSCR